jgi:hypothetical protein
VSACTASSCHGACCHWLDQTVRARRELTPCPLCDPDDYARHVENRAKPVRLATAAVRRILRRYRKETP